jgi:hypothetical protein
MSKQIPMSNTTEQVKPTKSLADIYQELANHKDPVIAASIKEELLRKAEKKLQK